MRNLKGTGAPTRKTVGAIGDIYTDTSTGKKYKCTFAYRENPDDDFDCQWVELRNGESRADNVAETQVEEVEEEPEKEVKEEEPEPEKESSTNRTNYAAYSKKNK